MRMTSSTFTLLLSLAIASSWRPPTARADLVLGGSFEAPPAAPALTPPWSGVGSAGTAANGLGGNWNATHGNQFAILTTWQTESDDASALIPPPYGSALGGLGIGGAAPVAALEAFLGYPSPGPLFGAAASQGSAIRTNFLAGPLERLEFDLLFLTNETFRGGLQDFAFYSLDGGPPVALAFAPSFIGPLPANGLFAFQSSPSWTTLSIALSPGAHSIAFGVVDFSDTLFSSALLIDNVRLTVVPEPTMLAYWAVAAVGCTWTIRVARRRWSRFCCCRVGESQSRLLGVPAIV